MKLGAVDTHSGSATFEIVAKEGAPALIESFRANTTIEIVFNNVEGSNATLPNGAKFTVSDGAKGTVTIPAMNYSVTDGTLKLDWLSGMPKGSTFTMKVNVLDKEGQTVLTVPFTTAPATAVETVITPSFNAGAGMHVHTEKGGAYQLMDENATITLNKNANISDADWVIVKVEGVEQNYVVKFGEFGARTLANIVEMANAGETADWFGTNPAGSLTVSFTLLDTTNHSVSPVTYEIAYDTGAENSTQEIGNRPTEAALEFTLKDSNSNNGKTESLLGGGAVKLTAEGAMAWTNVQDYVNFPTSLPHSGDTIEVTYNDNVGHAVKHTITVVRSNAVTGNSIFVKPMPRSRTMISPARLRF